MKSNYIYRATFVHINDSNLFRELFNDRYFATPFL